MADEAYCMKCRTKRSLPDDVEVQTLKNGRPALQAPCPECGTKLTKLMGIEAAKQRGWSPPGE